MNKFSCAIIEDQNESAQRLKSIIEDFTSLNVLKIIQEVPQSLPWILKVRPDILFLDVELHNTTAFEIITELHAHHFYPAIIIVSAHDQYAIKAIRQGVFDYLLKPIDVDDFLKAYNRFVNWKTKRIDTFNLPTSVSEKLSHREMEITSMLCQGKSSKDIADNLCISCTTVDTHRQNILRKLDCRSIQELLVLVFNPQVSFPEKS